MRSGSATSGAEICYTSVAAITTSSDLFTGAAASKDRIFRPVAWIPLAANNRIQELESSLTKICKT